LASFAKIIYQTTPNENDTKMQVQQMSSENSLGAIEEKDMHQSTTLLILHCKGPGQENQKQREGAWLCWKEWTMSNLVLFSNH
jgi:hypothetical protein